MQHRDGNRSRSLTDRAPTTRTFRNRYHLGPGAPSAAPHHPSGRSAGYPHALRNAFRLPLSARIEHMFVYGRGRRNCSFPDCDRTYYAKGLCRPHYTQQSHNRPLKPIRPRSPIPTQCEFERCDKRATNRGLCPAHAKQRSKGQPLRPLRPFYGTKGPCRFDGCPKPRAAGGYCAGHAAQYYGGRPLAPLFKPKVGCDFPGCTKRHFALGYCQGHWRQLREKRPLAPLREMKGWRIDRGYVYLFEPTHPNAHRDGYVAEHTKVMAEILGRPLERYEEVHHKNGTRSDNRPGNLELWARGMQPPGSRVSDLVDWAVRVLKLYRPELLASRPAMRIQKRSGQS
jgi:hypothetical protein